MKKLTSTKIMAIGVILFGMNGAYTTPSQSSTHAQANYVDKEYTIGTDGYQDSAPDPVVAGAGDIASCYKPEDQFTAALLGNIDGDVLTFGDNTQLDGTAEEFEFCYDPTWGVYKYKTHPTPGNHDYHADRALPYYAYFGSAAGEVDKGYYSYDIGYWHLIALNSNIDDGPSSPQLQWLQADLDSHQNNCILAYWHHPLFTSATSNKSVSSIEDIWDVLYAYGVDVVLNGHAHLYERFAPQTPQGVPDSNGIREFVVGTGGGGSLDNYSPIANSEVINNQTYGVIKLTLHPLSYDWEFIPIEGQTFIDSGSYNCSYENYAPIADAGPDQSVVTMSMVTLDGSGSSDPNGDPLNYLWTQTGGPAVSLSNNTISNPTFTAPSDPASLTFSLTVTDSRGMASSPDVVVINTWAHLFLPIILR